MKTKKTVCRALLAVLLSSLFFQGAASAVESDKKDGKADEERPAAKDEVEELKARVERLENMMKEGTVTDELGHKLHPIHSFYGLKISGGITFTAQGVGHMKSGPSRGAAAVSGDFVLESPVGKDGRAVAVLDVQSGAGLKNLPPFFTSPNGNPTGPNNDIESFNNDSLHVTQLYYEHGFDKGVVISAGKLDSTAFFDTNSFANNERIHYLANLFANNPAVEFGGTPDFYGPGLRLSYRPVDPVDISLGAFEGDGNFADAFDNPFVIAQTSFKFKPFDKDGNYRFYYWARFGRPDITGTANPNDNSLLSAENQGAGISFDQMVTDGIGIWLRAGTQRKKVAQFDRSVTGGARIAGPIPGRPNDAAGFAYGADFMGRDYKDFKKKASAFDSGTEHYMEAYYNFAVDGATDITGFHISPDLQYVINPGGDRNAGKLFIYGLRLQAFF